MRYLSVCSGIEAASVAWEPLGWQPVAFAEIEKFPAAVLAHRWPHVPNLGDMTKINGADFKGKIDVMVGGTPCQSFSVSGTLESSLGRSRGAGISPGAITQALTGRLGCGGPDDNKAQGGFYVPEIVNQAISCKWSKGTSGPAGDEHHNLIAQTLRAEGFDASEDGTGRQNLVVTPINTQVGLRHKALGERTGEVSCTMAALQGGADKPHVLVKSAVRRLTPVECARLQGFPDNHTLIVWGKKPPEECPDGPQYKAYGNSMATNVMRKIGEWIDRYVRENAHA